MPKAAEPYVYWSTAVVAGPKRIKRAELASGVVEIVAETTRELAAFAVDDDGTVYWVEASAAQDNAGAVMALRPGQAPTELYAIAESLDAFGMVIDEAHV